MKDYADKADLLNGSLDDLEDYWHQESQNAKIGKLAALFIIVVLGLGLALSFIYSKSSPAAVNTVSCCRSGR